jgi:tetratricopeptide (TPR) repeat protein
MYEAKKDPLKAIDYYNKSIKIDSTNHMAYNNIGHIYAGLKNYPLSLAWYTKAIEVYPRYFNAYRNRADVKLIIGDKLGACEDLKKAADLGDQKSQTAYNETCNKK